MSSNRRERLVEGLTVVVCPVQVGLDSVRLVPGSRRISGSSSIQPNDPSPLKVAK